MSEREPLLSRRKAVYIFVKDVYCGFFAHGGEPLLTIRGHPDAVAFSYGVPVLAEAIDALSTKV